MTNSLFRGLLKLQDYLKESCGAINPNGAPDKSGYGLEIYPEARKLLDGPLTVTSVLNYYIEHQELFDKYPALRLGWYSYIRLGQIRTELNIGAVGNNLIAVSELAAELNQKAIWDIVRQTEISIGGTGLQTYFRDFPLEQRLQHLQC
jgi:hypothetical protein